MNYIMREIIREDMPYINEWRNDDDLLTYLGAPFRYINLDVDYQWFENYMKNRTTTVRCCITKKENRVEPIGVVSLTDVDYLNRNAEFHIMIGKIDNQGNGAGRFGVKKMLEHGFMNLNLERIYSIILESNVRSKKLCESLGFQVEGIQRKAVFKRGEYHNMIMMSILKEDFIKNESE